MLNLTQFTAAVITLPALTYRASAVSIEAQSTVEATATMDSMFTPISDINDYPIFLAAVNASGFAYQWKSFQVTND